jgi:flagellar basal body-associated protein FliL
MKIALGLVAFIFLFGSAAFQFFSMTAGDKSRESGLQGKKMDNPSEIGGYEDMRASVKKWNRLAWICLLLFLVVTALLMYYVNVSTR